MRKIKGQIFSLILVLSYLFWIYSPVRAQNSNIILDLPTVGKVTIDPAYQNLTFTAYNPGIVPMEFSICWNELHWNEEKGWFEGQEKCIQSEVGGWQKDAFVPATKTIKLPHYKTVTITIGRYEKIAQAVCRENDGRLGCLKFYQEGAPSTCEEVFPPQPLPVYPLGENVSPKTIIVRADKITITPVIQVPAEDVGKNAELLLYLEQQNGAHQLLSSDQKEPLTKTVKIDLLKDCFPVSTLSFPIKVYFGYLTADGIKYNYYLIKRE